MNRKTRRQTQRRAKRELSADEAHFRGLGLIYDRAKAAKVLAEEALALLPVEAEEARDFYEEAITDLEKVMLETSKALLEPVLDRLRAEPEDSIIVP